MINDLKNDIKELREENNIKEKIKDLENKNEKLYEENNVKKLGNEIFTIRKLFLTNNIICIIFLILIILYLIIFTIIQNFEIFPKILIHIFSILIIIF